MPAILNDAEGARAWHIQLAENIHREDLSLKDLATAVRSIHDAHPSVTEVAGMLHKSKSWVSKHLALSEPGMHYFVRMLLEEGITEDLELLVTLDNAAKLDYSEAWPMMQRIREGEAGREDVRALLERLKNPPPAEAPALADQAPQGDDWPFRKKDATPATDGEAPARPRDPIPPHRAASHIGRTLLDHGPDKALEEIAELGTEERHALNLYLGKAWQRGADDAQQPSALPALLFFYPAGDNQDQVGVLETAAYLFGCRGQTFADALELVQLVGDMYRKACETDGSVAAGTSRTTSGAIGQP